MLAFALFASLVLPAIDGAVGYDDEVVAGDVLDLARGELTLVPAPGWNVEEGVRVGRTRSTTTAQSTTVLSDGDVRLTVTVAPFKGTPAALLARIDEINERFDDARGLGVAGKRFTIRTDAGAVGVAETFTRLKRQGTLAAFVVPVDNGRRSSEPTGVQILVAGSEGALASRRADIDGMVREHPHRSDFIDRRIERVARRRSRRAIEEQDGARTFTSSSHANLRSGSTALLVIAGANVARGSRPGR